jgi:hypothetical protein
LVGAADSQREIEFGALWLRLQFGFEPHPGQPTLKLSLLLFAPLGGRPLPPKTSRFAASSTR